MGAMAWPAPSPGAPLEAEGDLRPREMTVHDGIRLIGLLGSSSRIALRPYYGRTRGGIYAFALWANCCGAAARRLQQPGRRTLAIAGHVAYAEPGCDPADQVRVHRRPQALER